MSHAARPPITHRSIGLFFALALLVACDETSPAAPLAVRARGSREAPNTEGSAGVTVSSMPGHSIDAGAGARGGKSATSNAAGQEGCRPVSKNTEAIPQRVTFLLTAAKTAIYTPDLFNNLFRSHCGGCHVDQKVGDWQRANLDEFIDNALDDQEAVLNSIEQDDETHVMPPYAQSHKVWSDRKDDPNDPVRELDLLLRAWYAAGAPQDVFYVDPPNDEGGGTTDQYQLDADLAPALTTLGSCIPDKRDLNSDGAAMAELDQRFAALKTSDDLPTWLSATDLTSLDSEELGRTGVISYTPTYPLWSGGAAKMRYVRVPKGESIRFDVAAQSFKIPANTRFYKTFLQKVVGADGKSVHFRKLETRIIVVRPDGAPAADGDHATNALFGTYAWDESETTARLVQDPHRDGSRFRDRMVSYIKDEQLAQEVLSGKAPNKITALRQAKAMATWAIPGAPRCVQCHMGAPGKDFVLGFTAVQVKQRPGSEGGLYEQPGDDELAQLNRLIDYGVVTGVSSAADILPLEKSQGTRSPRNDYELKAQAYALGNCSHCHNPTGYATVSNPVLGNLLDFLPDGKNGGLFRFPLDRTSPRIKRGPNFDLEMPYITPSLVDYGAGKPETGTMQVDLAGSPEISLALNESIYIAAPWRSLIYRNVDTPYIIASGGLFPHMPMNVAGFDARVPRIFADWMVSIPARQRARTPADGKTSEGDFEVLALGQPYEEVTEDDPNYRNAQLMAAERLKLYHEGGRAPTDFLRGQDKDHTFTYFSNLRYSAYSPDVTDIVDYTLDPARGFFSPGDESALPSLFEDARKKGEMGPPTAEHYYAALKKDGVPDRPHWAVTDITEAPPPWYPRRSDWDRVLVENKVDDPGSGEEGARRVEKQRLVLAELGKKTLTPKLRELMLTPQPFTTWKSKSQCDLSAFPKISSFTGDKKRPWMKTREPDAAVYSESPGGMVYREICINCHGVNFDSRGRQADNLMLITGGTTRVANFRTGLFGPEFAPGANLSAVFGKRQTPLVRYEDLAARYMAWMALGGTLSRIDAGIMSLVSVAPALDLPRRAPRLDSSSDANMLSIARSLCLQTIGRMNFDNDQSKLDLIEGDFPWKEMGASVVTGNADMETWRKICTFDNPPPVAVLAFPGKSASEVNTYGLFDQAGYPPTAPVMDPNNQNRVGITPDNLMPWCMTAPPDGPTNPVLKELATQYRQGRELPLCPSPWLSTTKMWSLEDVERWGYRGAINAGFGVYLYLYEQMKNLQAGKASQPAYDNCEALKH